MRAVHTGSLRRVVEALMQRIGLAGREIAPDLDGLFTVHRAYLGAIPYEDLAVQLGETGPLDPAALVPRLVRDGRGGYCFELNTVLGWLLQELGFSLTHHQAVVGGVGPTNHMVLVVDLGGEPWIADAGLGEGFLDPLPLRPGTARLRAVPLDRRAGSLRDVVGRLTRLVLVPRVPDGARKRRR